MISTAKCLINPEAPLGVTFVTPLSLYPPQALRYATVISKGGFVQEVLEVFDTAPEAEDYTWAVLVTLGLADA